jgi:hypothetical protein
VSNIKFRGEPLTFFSPLCTIAQEQAFRSLKPTHIVQEECMKQSHLPLKTDSEQPKTLLKKLSMIEDRKKLKKRGFRQLRMVLSVNAGHVRGGHSFH